MKPNGWARRIGAGKAATAVAQPVQDRPRRAQFFPDQKPACGHRHHKKRHKILPIHTEKIVQMPSLATETWEMTKAGRLPVYQQLDILGQMTGHFGDHAAFQNAHQRAAMSRSQNQHVDAQHGGQFENGSRRIIADGV
jgi:hypothetical protein